jgi:N,N-dimethylformamidase
LSKFLGDRRREAVAQVGSERFVVKSNTPLTIATLNRPSTGTEASAIGLYNGKIGQPAIYDRALSPGELDAVRDGKTPLSLPGLVAFWDFTADPSSSNLLDAGPRRLHGKAINMPMRAVTGHNWSGEEIDFKHAPDQYGAIHFHDDDLEDARWQTDFSWRVPGDARSGFYAARVRSRDHEDHIPFFVRPAAASRRAKVLLLAPTFTYLAYANETHRAMARHQAVYTKRAMVKDPLDLYLDEHREFGVSLYDVHSDDSGSCYSSHLRPIPSLRPKYRQWQFASPRHLAADLYIVDWLEQKGFAYDVVTDHDLDVEGSALLEPYRVVLTGTHPEYWSSRMRDAMSAYLDEGGRQLYLGGNGYYWVTSQDPERPHVIEVRKGMAGTRAWNSAPGELYHSSTGELGGLWRHRGKPPNEIVGVGFKAMGYDSPAPGYRRQPGSFDPRVAFIFEGIHDEEVIGDFGLVLGGAAGDELDRIDYDLGTPPHALLLASASGHGHRYVPVVEDHNEMSEIVIVEQQSLVRADMVYFETRNGGAVFSVGSISWCGSLSHNGYQNNVSLITENVLRNFISGG